MWTEKKKQRGGGVGCVSRSLFLLALFSTAAGFNAAGLAQLVERLTAERKVAGSIPGGRTNTQGLKNNREMKVLYMPPSVNDLVLRSLREEVSYFLFLLQQRKKDTSARRLVLECTWVPNSSRSTLFQIFWKRTAGARVLSKSLFTGYFQGNSKQTFSLSISSSSRACSCSCSITESFSWINYMHLFSNLLTSECFKFEDAVDLRLDLCTPFFSFLHCASLRIAGGIV